MAWTKTGKLKEDVARKKRYLKHYKKAGPRHAMTYYEWLKKGESPTYFKGAGFRRKTVEAQMREAGATLKRKKR